MKFGNNTWRIKCLKVPWSCLLSLFSMLALLVKAKGGYLIFAWTLMKKFTNSSNNCSKLKYVHENLLVFTTNKCIWTLAKLFCYKQRKVDVLHEFIINFRIVPPAAQSANNVITIHVKSKLQHTLWHWKWLLIVSLKCCFNCNIIIGIFLLTISNL